MGTLKWRGLYSQSPKAHNSWKVVGGEGNDFPKMGLQSETKKRELKQKQNVVLENCKGSKTETAFGFLSD